MSASYEHAHVCRAYHERARVGAGCVALLLMEAKLQD